MPIVLTVSIKPLDDSCRKYKQWNVKNYLDVVVRLDRYIRSKEMCE